MKIKIALMISVVFISGCQLESKTSADNFDPSQVVAQVRAINLTASAQSNGAVLSWKAPDGVGNLKLYSARESISELDDLNNIHTLEHGLEINVAGNQHHLTGLENGHYYFFLLVGSGITEVEFRSREIQLLVRDQSIAFQTPINDSGRLQPDIGVSSCQAQHQDCGSGRDMSHNDNSDGFAGFSFTKLDQQGRDLAATAEQWHCAKDNVTGLVWEVKTDHADPRNRDLRDKRWLYTYFNSLFVDANGTDGPLQGQSFNGDDGIYGGKPDNGINSGEDYCGNSQKICTTEQYVRDVNVTQLCGFSDWRIPRFNELYSLKILQGSSAEIDTDYFPHTQKNYLSADYMLSDWFNAVYTPGSGLPEVVAGAQGVMTVHFNGHVNGSNSYGYSFAKKHGSVRLVRGGQ
ncbi:DUF1566 domain-containing protein [Bacterioplanoides sp.]|uniref:Lcl C-terminal domain-containing protein n=1 Tax=Bacterioplanoides sp. TaxID=2066072 RepID=UPI003B59B7E8